VEQPNESTNQTTPPRNRCWKNTPIRRGNKPWTEVPVEVGKRTDLHLKGGDGTETNKNQTAETSETHARFARQGPLRHETTNKTQQKRREKKKGTGEPKPFSRGKKG